jgi:TRIAD3 protein (E3 ubiquitin-protein ligase RNF216)
LGPAFSLAWLANHFSRLPVAEIRRFLRAHNGHLSPAFRSLESVITQLHDGETLNVHLLQTPRASQPIPCTDPLFEKEVEFLRKQLMKAQEKSDEQYARQLNAEQYEQCGQAIDCSCCFAPCAFEAVCLLMVVSFLWLCLRV